MRTQNGRLRADGQAMPEKECPGASAGAKKSSIPPYFCPAQALDEFREAIRAAGIAPPAEPIGDGRLHRFHVEGHRRGSKNGAYVFHPDGKPAGWFQDFKSGVSGTWKAGGGCWHLDEATRRQIEEDRRKRQAETEARHREVAAQARHRWDRANPCADHEYLARKGVLSYGLRVGDWPKWIEGPTGWRQTIIFDALLVPLFDEAGALWNLQAIFPEVHPELGRDKDFMGGRKSGLFFVIGASSDPVLVAEGYATAATLHEFTGCQVYVAFDAGNLKSVALTVRKLHPTSSIIVAADNDRCTLGNPGVIKAREAALAVSGLISAPEFPDGVPGSDWNDWHRWRADHGGV